ncbi:putative phage abortive infection protein [Enterobacter asburiae]|uniref:putative phage abortive infection protein n=1 Tax=Enterobacter asburiae TaxID=61645 RepID=UPI002A81671B|nr:putative phage abortive infection protein [Enterobacter asburiae]
MVQFIFIAVLGVVIVSFLYILLMLQIPQLFEGFDFNQTGTFGDSWGALTSVFSALGFFGVLWTLKTQNDSIRRVQKENNRKEINDIRRDFENSFFNMLNLLQVIINDMKVKNKITKEVKAEGRGIFLYFFKAFKSEMIRNGYFRVSNNDCEQLKLKMVGVIGNQYSKHFQDKSQNLSHYYRFLFNTFKFIDDAEIDDESKKKYANILRAQISNYELIMLFYNSLSIDGEKFRCYFAKYEILYNLPVYKLVYKNHVVLVDKKCWGDNKIALELFKDPKM